MSTSYGLGFEPFPLLLDYELSEHLMLRTFRIAEYAYVDNGTARLPNGEECITPLLDGSYVLLEQTGTIY